MFRIFQLNKIDEGNELLQYIYNTKGGLESL